MSIRQEIDEFLSTGWGVTAEALLALALIQSSYLLFSGTFLQPLCSLTGAALGIHSIFYSGIRWLRS